MAMLFVAALLATALRAAPLCAHEGPPFPILMDEPTAGYVVSVWADPDIGEAVFYVQVAAADGQRPQADAAPAVTLWVEPTSGRLSRIEYEGVRQDLRNRLQFEVRPHFDQRDMWTVGVRLQTPGGTSEELTTEVESTPPGLGAWDLAIYSLPFALLAGLWVVAIVRRRRAADWDDSITPPSCGGAETELPVAK
jgi:hypothetical protein